jgi:hypothetical protein
VASSRTSYRRVTEPSGSRSYAGLYFLFRTSSKVGLYCLTTVIKITNLSPRCVEHILSIQAPPFPLDKFTSVRELCFAAIRQFKPTALRSVQRGLGTGAVLRPIEGRYQDELYRACGALLGEVYISSEWSMTGSRGRVDFLVGSQRWAIECARDGDRLNEHISRFQEGGQYYDWIQNGDIGQYIVLDFRTSKPKKTRGIMLFILFWN